MWPSWVGCPEGDMTPVEEQDERISKGAEMERGTKMGVLAQHGMARNQAGSIGLSSLS